MEFNFWAKFPNRPIRNHFLSTQLFSVQNLKSTKAVKVLKTGMKILTRRVCVRKIYHKFRLETQGRRSALPQAWELIKFFSVLTYRKSGIPHSGIRYKRTFADPWLQRVRLRQNLNSPLNQRHQTGPMQNKIDPKAPSDHFR